jgi:sugar O-acyltransferase (sialic acid O-acetyltransferase NeuD family)
MENILIFGAGEIAEVAHIYLCHDSKFNTVAFTVDHKYQKSNSFRGLPLVDFESIVEKYPPDKFKLFIPISFRDLNIHRANKFRQAKEMGYQMISYISSKALIMPETTIGENCFIFEGNVIQPKVNIGDNCIIWSGNHIGHHTTIEEHCFIASHAVISGHVSIGSYSFIGVNATIRDNIKIAEKNVIGAGAIILRDTLENQVYKATPSPAANISSDMIRW